MEALFYAKLHQRYPVDRLNDLINHLELKELHTPLFIANFEHICMHNPHYSKRLLKWIIDTPLDHHLPVLPDPTSGEEFAEWLFPRYAELLSIGSPDPTKTDIIRYTIFSSPEVAVNVREAPYIISSSGTTGFRTWEAALYLSYYLCTMTDDKELSEASHVLELGAGTGIVSLTWLRLHTETTQRLYATDGDSTLVESTLLENFRLNDFDPTSDQRIRLQRLLWNADSIPQNNIILAADVTYHSDVIPDLIAAIKHSFISCGTRFALVAATIRNQTTITAFEYNCSINGLSWTVVQSTETVSPEAFVWQCTFTPLRAPIRIYRLSL